MDLKAAFDAKMSLYQPNFYAYGLLTAGDIIYPLGQDTKVLSTAFELIARPLLYEIAADHSLLIQEPESQNVYPDFTLMRDQADPAKIAVDIKSAYRKMRRDGSWTVSFTLGSYTSFLRTGAKNIVFPYAQYAEHWIIGFIYTRVDVSGGERRYDLAERSKVFSPIRDVEYFVQEKYRIASERPGSGNTTNIGSIVGSSVSDFALGKGPFAPFGEATFADYWRHYGRMKALRAYETIGEYLVWRANQPQP